MLGGRAGAALKRSNPAAYYAKYVAPQLDRPGMMGAAANVERQRLLKTITNQAVNPGLDIRPSPGTAVVAMPQGVPVYGQVQPAPAPSGGGGGGGGGQLGGGAGGGSNAAAQQLVQRTAQSEAYRKEATAAIEAGKLRIQQLEDEDLQRKKATELQNRLAIQAASSQARGATQANLKIGAASDTSRTAGTSAFKRRRDQMRLASIQSTAGINAPASSVLNV
jgi:hypothetical protein